jgi:hypothetical protein
MSKPGAAIRAAGWVTVGIVAAGGVATAATSGSSGSAARVTPAATSPSTGAAAGNARAGKAGRAGKLAQLKGRLLHGQFTVEGKDNKPVTRSEQRGTVQAGISATSITLTSTDSFNQTYVVTPDTKVRIDGKKSSISDVKAGQTAGVIAKVDGTTQTATVIIERAAK